MSDHTFDATVESLFKGMDSFITTKTVVGEPLVDVSFGVAAGVFAKKKQSNGGGGMGGKIMPSAVLVISNGTTKLVNVKNQDGITKVLDMVPDFVNKFTSKNDKKPETDPLTKAAAEEAMEDILSESVKEYENK